MDSLGYKSTNMIEIRTLLICDLWKKIAISSKCVENILQSFTAIITMLSGAWGGEWAVFIGGLALLAEHGANVTMYVMCELVADVRNVLEVPESSYSYPIAVDDQPYTSCSFHFLKHSLSVFLYVYFIQADSVVGNEVGKNSIRFCREKKNVKFVIFMSFWVRNSSGEILL